MMISLLFACSVLFQVPMILLFLIRTRILPVRVLEKSRGFIILIIAILAAIFSPPDVVSMLLVAIPLYIMFELTVLIGKMFKGPR